MWGGKRGVKEVTVIVLVQIAFLFVFPIPGPGLLPSSGASDTVRETGERPAGADR